jgi:hypothetical protein
LIVAEQVHPPVAADALHVTEANPSAESGPEIPSQVVVVPESIKQAGASSSDSVPVVVVWSVYVPSALAVHVPVTWSDPVTGAGAQFNPASVRSCSPLNVRQDDVGFHVPTTLPPHGATLEHDMAAPPAPELPPVPDGGGFDVVLHAPRISPKAAARTRDLVCDPIERAFMTSLVGRPRFLS